MATTAPARLRGYVSEYDYNTFLDEIIADLPVELMWPLSVGTYAAMRRESHVNAGLNGYTLQLRRAQWQLDGRGCRPEVTKLVAEDLGLLMTGQEATGAARVRGVSWNDHLRAALLYLTFGHMGFELAADTSSGQARLVGLAERLPHTISQIFSDAHSGEFQGVSQHGAVSSFDRPLITADRMAWYCHEREGASWAGVSMLRSIWPAFVVKREMLKVHALANRRWGMGVPVMEALPGTSPTPEQMSQAMQMAAAARAGEQAGAASPPNFTMKIMGITGSVPDTLSFLRFLNQEISSGLLMPHMDLGSTPNGSRALGESFTESWILALGALGSEICDVATRQIAARIVEWNFGPDEAVPSVVVSGIGEQRDVTAQSLQLLLTSGALSADPALEEWVRREYRLPERQGAPDPKVSAPGVDLPKDQTDPQPTEVQAAARPRGRRKRTPAQPGLFGDDEADAHRLQQQWDDAKARLLKRWPKLAGPMVDELAGQAEAAIEAGDLAALGSLEASAGVVAALAVPIRQTGTELAAEAAAGVVEEAAKQAVTITAPDRPGADRVRQHADAVARIIASGYAAGAARISLQLSGAGPQEVRDEVERHLADLGTSENGLVGTEIGGLLSAAQHAGRLAVLEQHPIKAVYAVEVNDKNRCLPCSEAAGRRFTTLQEALKLYPVAGNRSCLGGIRCRGYLRAEW